MLSGVISSQFLAILTFIIAARLLGQESFGELGMVMNTVIMFGTFAGMGISTTAMKYVAELRQAHPTRAGNVIGLCEAVAAGSGLLFSVVLFICAPLIASKVLNAPHLTSAVQAGCPLLLFSVLSETQQGALSGFEDFKVVAKLRLFHSAVRMLALFLMARLAGLNGAVWALGVAALAASATGHLWLRSEARRRFVRIAYTGLSEELPMLWRFSLPALLAGVMTAPAMWVAGAILVRQPGGYSEMGIFNAANQWHRALLFLPSVLAGVNVPVLASLYGRREIQDCRKVMLGTIRATVLLIVPATILVALIAEPIMASYGPQFRNHGEVLIIVCVVSALLAAMVPAGQVITATGRMWLGMFMNLGWAIVLIVSTVLFVRQNMGAAGLALAYLAAYTVHSVWTFGFAVRFARE